MASPTARYRTREAAQGPSSLARGRLLADRSPGDRGVPFLELAPGQQQLLRLGLPSSGDYPPVIRAVASGGLARQPFGRFHLPDLRLRLPEHRLFDRLSGEARRVRRPSPQARAAAEALRSSMDRTAARTGS